MFLENYENVENIVSILWDFKLKNRKIFSFLRKTDFHPETKSSSCNMLKSFIFKPVCRTSVLLAFLTLFFSKPSAAQFPNFGDGNKLVQPSLVVGTTNFREPFTIGIRFQLEPEWHVYWKNAGDAGTPVEVQWHLPDGFRVSKLAYPVPIKFTMSGIVGYGYGNEVIFFAKIEPPKNFSPKTAPVISANLSWLVCRESCIPGEGEVSLNFETLSSEDIDEGKRLIEKFEAKLPEEISKLDLKLEQAIAKGSGKNVTAELRFSGKQASDITDFFPDVFEKAFISYNDIQVTNGTISFPLELSAPDAKLPEIRGLLITKNHGYEFSAPLSRTTESLLDDSFQVAGERPDESPLWMILILAFVGGLLLNIMPCVLPVLSLKVLSFVQHSSMEKSHTRYLSFIFALGVLVSFWVLALGVGFLQNAGEQIGWGFQFQSPWFVVGMSVVVFIFGMNLVGVFEFASPNVTGDVSKTLSRNDALGAFMNGILATTLATPCTAPFLGTALGFAFSQPFYMIFLIFSLVALGLAAPYVILSLNPAWLKFIPKPGVWMERFKQAMGFLLFATLVWLLSVLGTQTGSAGVLATLTLLLGVSVGLWLIGSFIDFNATLSRKITIWTLSLLLAISAYYLGFEKWFSIQQAGQTETQTPNSHSGLIDWQPFSIAMVEREVLGGKTVFIDFTADWCFTCKVTEQTVLETEAVSSKIKVLGIVPVRADWTNRNDEITGLLKKFGRSGVPLYVVFPAGKLSEPIVLPEVITEALLLEAFEKATAK